MVKVLVGGLLAEVSYPSRRFGFGGFFTGGGRLVCAGVRWWACVGWWVGLAPEGWVRISGYLRKLGCVT